MKKLGIFALAVIMVMGLALSAQAFQTINPAPSGEVNLWDIINGFTGLTLNQGDVEGATVQPTLLAGNYILQSYATYAAFSETLDVPGKTLVSTPPNFVSVSGVNIAFNEAAPFAFTDSVNSGAFTLATDGTGTPGHLPGLIIPLSQFPGGVGFIVAFEDGGSNPPLGDQDYNDMVGYVVVPIPPSALLMGPGLLVMGLVGLRRFRKG